MNKLLIAVLACSALASAQNPWIIGGEEVAAGTYPWVARLTFESNGFSYACSGVLVASNRILTAAHCVQDDFGNLNEASTYSIHIGGVSLTDGTEVGASQLIVHPSYDPVPVGTDLKNDIAIIVLDAEVSLTPIAIPAYDVPIGVLAKAIGWGVIDITGTTTNKLRHADVTTIAQDNCVTGPDYNEFCANGSATTGQGTCAGDSGGPLAINTEGTWLLFGITQGGIGVCVQSGTPGIFTSTVRFRDFLIANNVPLKRMTSNFGPPL